MKLTTQTTLSDVSDLKEALAIDILHETSLRGLHTSNERAANSLHKRTGALAVMIEHYERSARAENEYEHISSD